MLATKAALASGAITHCCLRWGLRRFFLASDRSCCRWRSRRSAVRRPSPPKDAGSIWRGPPEPARKPKSAVDFVETEKDYELTVDLPGLDEKEVEVKITGVVLTVKAEK